MLSAAPIFRDAPLVWALLAPPESPPPPPLQAPIARGTATAARRRLQHPRRICRPPGARGRAVCVHQRRAAEQAARRERCRCASCVLTVVLEKIRGAVCAAIPRAAITEWRNEDRALVRRRRPCAGGGSSAASNPQRRSSWEVSRRQREGRVGRR